MKYFPIGEMEYLVPNVASLLPEKYRICSESLDWIMFFLFLRHWPSMQFEYLCCELEWFI